jgi:hypothetical protein
MVAVHVAHAANRPHERQTSAKDCCMDAVAVGNCAFAVKVISNVCPPHPVRSLNPQPARSTKSLFPAPTLAKFPNPQPNAPFTSFASHFDLRSPHAPQTSQQGTPSSQPLPATHFPVVQPFKPPTSSPTPTPPAYPPPRPSTSTNSLHNPPPQTATVPSA